MVRPPSRFTPHETRAGLTRDSGCRMCPLHETAEFVCLLGEGPSPSPAMMIGEAPGRREDDSGRPFVGRTGELLDALMHEVGLSRDDVYISNAVHCRPPDNRTPRKSEINKCRPWIEYEIAAVKPKVVLLLGSTPLQAVLGRTGIKKLRGQPITVGDITYLPTVHPSYVLRDDRARPLLRSDLAKFKAMIEGGGLPRIKGLNHTIVETEDDVRRMLRHLASLSGFVYDLETTGLYPWQGDITSINVGDRHRQWCIPVSAEAWSVPWTLDQVYDIVQRIDALKKQKCNHNGKFDALWMAVHFGVDWRVDFDTMLAHYILDENARHGLDNVASERYGALDWDVPLKMKQGKEGTLEDHARYACLDVLYTSMLWEDLEEDIAQQPGIRGVFDHLLMPAAKMFVDVELHGITVDRDKFDEVERKLTKAITEYDTRLETVVPGINWGSSQQVARVLFNDLGLSPLDMTKGGKPSTSESVLKRLAPQHEVARLLLKRREARQQLSFFIEGWKPWLVRSAGRWVLHPSFKFHGAVTGRLSCENPNLQQVPRDPTIRQLITAKPGWVLVEADLSQIEMRIAAELSGDTEMLRCFQTGVDVHWRTLIGILQEGGNFEYVQRTATMYCLRQGLSANKRSAEILSRVWRTCPKGISAEAAISKARRESQGGALELSQLWSILSTNGTGTEKLPRVSSGSEAGTKTSSLLRQDDASRHNEVPTLQHKSSSSQHKVVSKLQENSDEGGVPSTLHKIGEDKVSRRGERRQPTLGQEPDVERSCYSQDSSRLLSEEFVRALWEYTKLGPTPQEFQPNRLEFLEPGDSLSLLSSISPQSAEEIDYEWKERRKRAKSVGFGFLFGMGWKKYREYARDNYDLDVNEKDAQTFRNVFFQTYGKLSDWHRRQRQFAHRHGYVRSLAGRRRRLPAAMSASDTPERGAAERQAINSPVQSFASDYNLMIALELCERHPLEYCRLVGTVHDSILVEVRVDKAKQVVDDILSIAKKPRLLDVLGVELRVPIESEAKIGPWGRGISPEKYFHASNTIHAERVAEMPKVVRLQVRRPSPSARRVTPAVVRHRSPQDY